MPDADDTPSQASLTADTIQAEYKSLFHTIASYMAPQPGRLYTVSPRRRLELAVTSSATAANAFNSASASFTLKETFATADALWLEAVSARFNCGLAGTATLASMEFAILNAAATIQLPGLGYVVTTPLTISNAVFNSFGLAIMHPFISQQDLIAIANLRGVPNTQPYILSMTFGFTNGAAANQTVTGDFIVLYRKVSSQQEG